MKGDAAVYQALYRKWRPRTFQDVVGQEAITRALTSQVEAGRVGHAYLFTGTRGTGKTTCAKVLAKTVNCENPGEDGPCGECPCCVGIDDGSILDVIEIDAASNNGVDDVRDLRDETVYRPGRCRYKVYIIDEVHMLSTAAFNALLKILEEPPSHVIFILATTELHKVPATILSRCQRFDFTRIPAEKIKARLLWVAQQEGIAITDGAAGLVAVLGDGSMRDALSLLDTCAAFGEAVDEDLVRRMAGVADKSYLFSLSDAAGLGDTHALLELVASLREKSVDVKRLTEELVVHYRNFLLATAKPDGSLLNFLPEEERAAYAARLPKGGEEHCIRALHRLAAALERMSRSQDARVELELALLDLAMETADRPSAPPVASARPAPPPPPVTAEKAPLAASLPQKPSAEKADVDEDRPPWEEASPPEPAAKEAPQPPPAEAPAPQKAEALSASPTVAPAPAPQPPPDGSAQPFDQWKAVVECTAALDPMVYSFLKSTKAYFDGRRVLIDGGEVFMEFIRSSKSVGEVIKNAIQQTTGQRYGIGPFKQETRGETPAETAKKTLAEWEQKGVLIEYENEPDEKT